MGAPKQRWSSEEEAALKRGVVKYGAGKWRSILRDPDFSEILRLRSNVDLKDKWRNICVTASGWGSRDKARQALKKSTSKAKKDSLSPNAKKFDDMALDVRPLSVSGGNKQIACRVNLRSRLDSIILEAITSLREPTGSKRTAIAAFIMERYYPPRNFKHLLSVKLKTLIACGKLIKIKRTYRLAPSSSKPSTSMPLLDTRLKEHSKEPRDEFIQLTPQHVEDDLANMMRMTTEEAAIYAAKAVAEAEIAIAEAEEAARAAEVKEAQAESARAFCESIQLFYANATGTNLAIPV